MKLFQYKKMIWGTKNGPFLTWEVISIWHIFTKILSHFITLISNKISPYPLYPCKNWSTQWFLDLIYIIVTRRKLFLSIPKLFQSTVHYTITIYTFVTFRLRLLGKWAVPCGTAIQGQLVKLALQATDLISPDKNQINIEEDTWSSYQILSW